MGFFFIYLQYALKVKFQIQNSLFVSRSLKYKITALVVIYLVKACFIAVAAVSVLRPVTFLAAPAHLSGLSLVLPVDFAPASSGRLDVVCFPTDSHRDSDLDFVLDTVELSPLLFFYRSHSWCFGLGFRIVV